MFKLLFQLWLFARFICHIFLRSELFSCSTLFLLPLVSVSSIFASTLQVPKWLLELFRPHWFPHQPSHHIRILELINDPSLVLNRFPKQSILWFHFHLSLLELEFLVIIKTPMYNQIINLSRKGKYFKPKSKRKNTNTVIRITNQNIYKLINLRNQILDKGIDLSFKCKLERKLKIRISKNGN